MEKYIIFILLTYGISNIVVYGYIFYKQRQWLNIVSPDFLGALVSCMMCFGFWSGIMVSLLYYMPIKSTHDISFLIGYKLNNEFMLLINLFLNGVFGSATTWLIHTLQEMFEKIQLAYRSKIK